MDQIQTQLFVGGASAFAGAFFVFLFLRLAEFFTKLYQRKVRHYNSLILLETQIMEIGGIINDNLYSISQINKAFESDNVPFNRLRPLLIDSSHYENFYDLTIKNVLFSYNYKLRQTNDDIEGILKILDYFNSALIQKNIEYTEYKRRIDPLVKQLRLIYAFLLDLQSETISLSARIRVQIRLDKPLGTKLMSIFLRSKGSNINNFEIQKEEEVIKKEIEEARITSLKEIEAVVKKVETDSEAS